MTEDDFKRFTHELADRVRVEERRRAWRLFSFLAALIVLLSTMMLRSEINDHHLREALVANCEGRNVFLEIQRNHYRQQLLLDLPPAGGSAQQRQIYIETLTKLATEPPAQDCGEFR